MHRVNAAGYLIDLFLDRIQFKQGTFGQKFA